MKNLVALAAVSVVSLTLTGCHTLHKDDGVERDWLGREIEIEYKVPSKVVAIWANSVFNTTGEGPKRGLGGRVYFYDDQHRPVQVDGKLSVYVYDDTDSHPGDKLKQEATRVFHFDRDEVKSKFSPTEFGASYSFWVPWDNVGGERKRLGVIPVFTDATGEMVVGEQARQLLPGREPIQVTDENGETVKQVSYTERWTENLGERPKRNMSSKIQLPQSMQDRLRKPPARRNSWNIYEASKQRMANHTPTPSQRAAAMEEASNRQFQVTVPKTQNSDTPDDGKEAGVPSSQQQLSVGSAETQDLFSKAGMPIQSKETGLPPMRSKFASIYAKSNNNAFANQEGKSLLGSLPVSN